MEEDLIMEDRLKAGLFKADFGPDLIRFYRGGLDSDGTIRVEWVAEVVIPSEWLPLSSEEFMPWADYFALVAEGLLGERAA
jgi:hypothetical protein